MESEDVGHYHSDNEGNKDSQDNRDLGVDSEAGAELLRDKFGDVGGDEIHVHACYYSLQ